MSPNTASFPLRAKLFLSPHSSDGLSDKPFQVYERRRVKYSWDFRKTGSIESNEQCNRYFLNFYKISCLCDEI